MTSMWVEMRCPVHGLERFNIKIVKKYNMQPDTIVPKFRSRPTVGDLRCLQVGRNVSYKEIQGYLNDYFRQKGWMDSILGVRFKV